MLEFEGNNSNKTLNSLNFKGLIPIIPINLLLIEKKKNVLFHHQINLPRPTQTSKVMVS